MTQKEIHSISYRKGPSNKQSRTAYATGRASYVNRSTKQVLETALSGFDGQPRNRHERRRRSSLDRGKGRGSA